MKKLNIQGFSHLIVIALFVMLFAIGGVAYLVASHADELPAKSTSNSSPSSGSWTHIGNVTASQLGDSSSPPNVIEVIVWACKSVYSDSNALVKASFEYADTNGTYFTFFVDLNNSSTSQLTTSNNGPAIVTHGFNPSVTNIVYFSIQRSNSKKIPTLQYKYPTSLATC